ncbi:MAG: hypothetical protein M0P02_01410 [Sulfurospirillaceae bacterium]|nr:hypothetical protein [Sulfurospirillaceae bacterium]MCK9545833.1 hypothetical protein [Sulfurospirillaceae bacterium]NLN00251.1 hypothetical protein [Campylobacteraceae bacterium]
MELKDIILSTLAELEEPKTNVEVEKEVEKSFKEEPSLKKEESPLVDLFLSNIRERILVLFEGFQSPNNKNIEAKLDLTLNFLEYLLASIDEYLKEDSKTLTK